MSLHNDFTFKEGHNSRTRVILLNFLMTNTHWS